MDSNWFEFQPKTDELRYFIFVIITFNLFYEFFMSCCGRDLAWHDSSWYSILIDKVSIPSSVRDLTWYYFNFLAG
jgi:hypothetical protein